MTYARLLAILGGATLLVWPAFVNRYPLLFSDTGGLLEMGLLPSMGWNKPFVYGPIVAALSLHLTLWLPLLAQGVLLSYTLWLIQLATDLLPSPRGESLGGGAGVRSPSFSVAHHLALCAVLAIATAAPWFTATLMPDVFTPVVVLSIIAAAAPLPTRHRLAAVAIGAIAIAAHLSHLIVAIPLLAALTLLRPFSRNRIPWHSLASLVAAILFLVASNWIGNGRLAISPYGSVFALARLVADGPARNYLDRTCPQAGWGLCAWRDQLTDDSDQFLWDPKSPFWSDPMPLDEFAAQASQIVWGTIRTDPLHVLRDAYRNSAHQLIRVELGDTLGPDYIIENVRPIIERYYPAAELQRFDAARQANSSLEPLANTLRPLDSGVLLAALLAATAILLAGLRTPSPRADLTALILIALAANAFASGALSAVHDRYEARLAWLLLLPILIRFKPRVAVTAAPALRNRAPAPP